MFVEESALFPGTRRGSRCRRTGNGSGATRIEADLSIKLRERKLMRRASICVAVLGLALLAIPSAALAVPTVTFKAKAVPIKGFPHTGNILGAGAAIEA